MLSEYIRQQFEFMKKEMPLPQIVRGDMCVKTATKSVSNQYRQRSPALQGYASGKIKKNHEQADDFSHGETADHSRLSSCNRAQKIYFHGFGR